MEQNDTTIVDEILSILKLAEYPFWSHPIALDRRDTALYIQQIIDKFEEVDIEACEDAEDEIKGLESDIKELNDEIESLKAENEILSRKLLSNKTKGGDEDGR